VQLVRNEGGGPGSVRLASAAGRWILAVAVLGEAMVLLEATVVNVALPSIGRDLRAGVAGLQWTLNGYVLTLAALVLAAGSLSDIYGRRRVFTLGTAVFVAASALCAAAPTIQLPAPLPPLSRTAATRCFRWSCSAPASSPPPPCSRWWPTRRSAA
jgi:MFS family permease